jgi:hypothetical protein
MFLHLLLMDLAAGFLDKVLLISAQMKGLFTCLPRENA